MTLGKRVLETSATSRTGEQRVSCALLGARLGAIAIGIGLVVFSRVVANMPADAPVAVATEPLNK